MAYIWIFLFVTTTSRGNIPASLAVDFYDRSPADAAAIKLGNTFLTPSASASACSNYEQDIQKPATGKVFAVSEQRPNGIPAVLPG